MKKIIFSFITLGLCSSVFAQNINFNLDTLKTYFINAGFDKDNNGEISFTEADSVKTILFDYNSPDTISLQDLNYFKNVEVLKLNVFAAKDIDLHHMTELQELNFSVFNYLNYNNSVCIGNNLKLKKLFYNLEFLDISQNKLVPVQNNWTDVSLSKIQELVVNRDQYAIIKNLGWGSWIDINKVKLKATDHTSPSEIYFSDNNLNKELLSQNPIIDLNQDGKISTSEALQVKYLNAENKNICSLNGLQYFTNLKKIDFDNNYIHSFNPLENSQKFQVISLTSNRLKDTIELSLDSLRYLDVSKNELKVLVLNKISTLDSLNCSFNALSKLELGDDNNYFNSGLASGSGWAARPGRYLSKYPYINASSFYKVSFLDCSNNNFTQLGLSTCGKIGHLKCEGNSTLDYLDLSALEIDSLSLMNTADVHICNANSIGEIKNAADVTIFNECANNQIPFQHSLLLPFFDLNNNGVVCFAEANEGSIQNFNLSNQGIKYVDGLEYYRIGHLDLSNNLITDIYVSRMTNQVYDSNGNKSLVSRDSLGNQQYINFSGNQLTSYFFDNNFRATDSINLSNNQLTHVEFVNSNDPYGRQEFLDLSNNRLGNLVLSATYDNHKIRNLNISGNNFDCIDVSTLPNLERLNTVNNPTLSNLVVNASQLSTYSSSWSKDSHTNWTQVSCDLITHENALKSTVSFCFPNPFDDFLSVSNDLEAIYSIDGTLIFSFQGNDIVNVSDLSSGVYVAKFKSGQMKKIVKK